MGLGVFSNFDKLPKFLIYPNPFCDYLNISFPDNLNIYFCLSVFNINGELIFKNYYISSAVLSTKDFTDGVYLIKLDAEEKSGSCDSGSQLDSHLGHQSNPGDD